MTAIFIHSNHGIASSLIRSAGTTGNGLLNGLLVYWALDEAAGQRNDSHTNAYHMAEVGVLGTDTGLVYPNAAHFQEGVDNYLSRTMASSSLINFSASTPFTIAIFCYPTSFLGGPDAPAYYKMMLTMGSGSAFGGGYYIMTTNLGEFYISLGKATGPPQFGWHTGFNLTLNVWHLVAVTHNANAVVAYVNGSTANATNTFGFTIATGPTFRIGINYADLVNYDGRLGPIAMWNRALSTPELDTYYNAGAGLPYVALTV